MQVYPNRFQQHLEQQPLMPFYLLFGDEPQQKMDMLDHLRKRVKSAGYTERKSLTADSEFNWQELIDATQTMSLFADKEYIELHLPTGKPGTEGAKVLTALAANMSEDVIITITGPKIGKDVQKTKWFSNLEKMGCFSHCYDLEGNNLRLWLQQRCNHQGIALDANAMEFLIDACQGNLMAARQEIDKLPLLFGDKPSISLQDLSAVMVDHSRFTVFQLVDEILLGDMQKAIKILLRLESEGIEPNMILWALIKEAQTLQQCKAYELQGQAVNYKKMRIWQNKQNLYQRALSRLDMKAISALLGQLEYADHLLKSEQQQRPYVILSHLVLMFMPAPLSDIALA